MTRDEVFQEFTRWTGWPNTTRTIHQTHWYDMDAMADDIVRLRAILAALREPSEAVIRAAQQKWDGDYCRMGDAIIAALAAAEKEVES